MSISKLWPATEASFSPTLFLDRLVAEESRGVSRRLDFFTSAIDDP